MGVFLAAWLLLLAAGCATSPVVPAELEPQVDRDISFAAVRADPEKYRGRLIVLGGKVLSSKRLKDHTQIEVLQLPLDRRDQPVPKLQDSQGRFLGLHTEFLDPATLPAGTLVSMVAEVDGKKVLPLDEVDYTYPAVNIRSLKVWPHHNEDVDYPYWWDPWPYPYWYRPYPFRWYPYWPYW